MDEEQILEAVILHIKNKHPECSFIADTRLIPTDVLGIDDFAAQTDFDCCMQPFLDKYEHTILINVAVNTVYSCADQATIVGLSVTCKAKEHYGHTPRRYQDTKEKWKRRATVDRRRYKR